MLGSLQSRLTSTSTNLDIYDENLSAANSRIRDTDYATATSNLARQNIVEDAATAVSVQTKEIGNSVLKLL